MAYYVDRVVICDAYAEPNKHYQLLPGGRSRLVDGRRRSKRYLASARDAKSGLTGLLGREATLFDDLALAEVEQLNETVNQIRDEVRDWREAGYPGVALVSRRLLEWWFERDEERAATGQRFFFAQREAVETVIYLYEAQTRRRMPETGDLLRYALKLATGTGKTVVMALLITWATLHKARVSGSTLARHFLVLTPNLTVRARVSGEPRGDGLIPNGEHDLYTIFDMIPPELRDLFQPKVIVRNWQSIPLNPQRDDWLPESTAGDGRLLPASVIWAIQRRARQDPNAAVRKLLEGARDLIVINDEAHHAYGAKKVAGTDETGYTHWHKIIQAVSQVTRLALVVDLSATPWYGSGSPKPDGALFEWLVSDFSVYDAFESGLVKIVRLPDPDEGHYHYLDLWDRVRDTRTQDDYLAACGHAIAGIYSGWREAYLEWSARLPQLREGPAPVLLVVADNKDRAQWLFDHLSGGDYDLLRNPAPEDTGKPSADDIKHWVTLRIDSGVFDAETGNEAVIRDMVNTVGKKGAPGENVRCIVSVNMLSEGWDVKAVTHILGLRAFGSPLLTEQVVGRGLRRTNYDILNQPLAERPIEVEETVDAFGIPFVGFPVQRRHRAPVNRGTGVKTWIEPAKEKAKYALSIPNVTAWAYTTAQPLDEAIDVEALAPIDITP